MESLPQPLLLQVLRLLQPEDLLRFSLASHATRLATSADELWRHCWPSGQPPPLPVGGLRAAYCGYRRSQCAECGKPTPHAFVPLGCRLCVACEQRNPIKYGLASELEARERYGVSSAALDGLPSVLVMRRRWYLRSAVAALSRATHIGRAGSSSSQDGSDSDSDGTGSGDAFEQEGEAAGGSSTHAARMAAAAAHAELNDLEAGPEQAGLEGRLAALELQHSQREARREERKQAKKQAKAEQRAKRELKAHGLHWQGPKQPNAQASGGSSHSPGNGRRGRGDGKKARYQEQRLARSKGEPVASRRGSKATSSWLVEREKLFEEYGVFDASGLILAAESKGFI